MSEHDEPKTALTRLVIEHAGFTTALGRQVQPPWTWRCWCGHEEAWDPADDVYRLHAAHLADVLLAEGYTTSPAPEATETVEWEWAATDSTSVDLEMWPDEHWARGSRRAAEMDFVNDGDDVLLRRRAAGPWVPVDRAADEHEEGGPPDD